MKKFLIVLTLLGSFSAIAMQEQDGLTKGICQNIEQDVSGLVGNYEITPYGLPFKIISSPRVSISHSSFHTI